MSAHTATELLLSGLRPSASAARLAALLPHLSFRELHQDAKPQQPLVKPKRFYKSVHVAPVPGKDGYQILLDTKPVRTPAKHLVVLPSLPSALAVAAEWEWQETGKPQLHTMPMMSLVAHALDQPRPREKVVSHILNYVHTDSACCLYEEGALARRQRQVFVPILQRLEADMGWRFVQSSSIAGSHQTDQLVDSVRRWLEGLDVWQLAATEQLTATCKSLVLGAALVRGAVGPGEALAAARLEEDFQAEEWGRVEAGHDLDEADIRSRLFGPSVFLRLLQLR